MVVYQASNLLRSATTALREAVNVRKWERVLQLSKVDANAWDMDEEKDHSAWMEAVSCGCSTYVGEM